MAALGRFALFVAIAAALRAQTFGNPAVGFDEQFYLMVGDRMWAGALPYVDIFDRKPVGLFAIFAAIRLLGGDGVLAYQLIATISVAATAWIIHRIAAARAGTFAGWFAGIAYLGWLNLMEGEGGQSPLFYNLPMAAAALCTMRIVDHPPRAFFRAGAWPMILAGLAMQIKYNAAFEGALFGLALLWTGWQRGLTAPRLLAIGAGWIALALAPTVAAGTYYAAIGHGGDWWYANFVSFFGQGRDAGWSHVARGAGLAAILLPLIVLSWHGRRDAGAFLIVWAVVAVVAVFAFGRFGSPHYALSAIVPLSVLAGLGAKRTRGVAVGLLAVAILVGQVLLATIATTKGTRASTDAIVAATRGAPGCIYVFDGMPILYHLTQSCLPTRFAFPSHLSLAKEALPGALPTDARAELAHVLASRPGVIIDDRPYYHEIDPTARAMLAAALARDYRLAATITHGGPRERLVYRRTR